jgi:hypothetical protein
LRGPVLGALAAHHEGAVANDKLRVCDAAAVFDAQALAEPERAAEPVNSFADVGIDQHWHDGSRWRRSVCNDGRHRGHFAPADAPRLV